MFCKVYYKYKGFKTYFNHFLTDIRINCLKSTAILPKFIFANRYLPHGNG